MQFKSSHVLESHVVGTVVAERVGMLLVVIRGSKNTRGDTVYGHRHPACATGYVRTFLCIFLKGRCLSSFRSEVSGSLLFVTGIFGCKSLMPLGPPSVLWRQELGWV